MEVLGETVGMGSRRKTGVMKCEKTGKWSGKDRSYICYLRSGSPGKGDRNRADYGRDPECGMLLRKKGEET